MNFSKRSAAPVRFPPPTRGVPCNPGGQNGGGGSGGQTPACRGKPCCIKPTDDSCFRIAACDDEPLPVSIDGTVDVAGNVGINGTVEVSLGTEPLCVGVELCGTEPLRVDIDGPVDVQFALGSEPLEVAGCIGVEMCGSEPLCVQMENKPDTTLCTTSFNYAPISSIKEDTGCAYTSKSFRGNPPNEEQLLLPFFYATNVPVICAPSDQIVRVKSLQQRFNSGSVVDRSAGLTGWKVSSGGQKFFQSATFEEMEMIYGEPTDFNGLPCDMACKGLGVADKTFIYRIGEDFSSSFPAPLNIDLAPNDVLVGTVETPNPNDASNSLIYPYYTKDSGDEPPIRIANFQSGDFKVVSCCQPRPSCVEPLRGVQETYVTDLQVFELSAGAGEPTIGVPFCIVDCENVPITANRQLQIEMDMVQGLGNEFTLSSAAAKFANPNKYEAKFALALTPLITVKQIRVRDVPSDLVLYGSTQEFILGESA